jgi:chemotaxis regulatin CheY-phosphate phosphatase CheZ
MNQQELDGILQKATELKVFCEYGQRTVPVLDDIAAFVQEISPAIEDLKSVVDMAMINIPKAADQLGRVTQATEQASTNILNTLDRMVVTLDEVISAVAMGMVSSDLGAAQKKMAAIIKTLAERMGNDDDIIKLAEFWESYLRSMRMSTHAKNLEGLLKTLQNDCTEIMMALQVQDITQQHIGTAMGTIESVAEGLGKLTNGFFNAEAKEEIPIVLPFHHEQEEVAEDDRKKMVESLLQKARTGQL